MTPRRRPLFAALRSRRLAVACFLVVVAFGLVGTIVPQGDPATDPESASWSRDHPLAAAVVRPIRLGHVYTSAPFILVVLLTAASTTACAWERTGIARRLLAGEGRVTSADVEALRVRPTFSIGVVPGGDPMPSAAGALGSLGMRVRQGPVLLEATRGRAGLLGSPLFHWSLVALIAVICLGQLTRSEGIMGVPVGGSRIDETASYARVDEGPLYPGHSGLRVGVSRIERDHVDGQGVPRGTSPLVVLRRGGIVLARGLVYPNAPLRHGTLLIHVNGDGLYPTLSVLDPEGTTLGSEGLFVDFDAEHPDRTVPARLDLSGAGLEPVAMTVQALPPREATRTATLADVDLAIRLGAGSDASSTLVSMGEGVALPGGYRLVYRSMVRYARLSIADDWSVYPIYALFGLAAAGLALALLVPYRRVRVTLVEADGGAVLHCQVHDRRRDPMFAESVEKAVAAALAAGTEGGSP